MTLLTLIGAIRLSKFKWGHAFWKMNGEYIKRYRMCDTAEEMMAMQDLFQKEMVDDRIQRKARQGESVFHLYSPLLTRVQRTTMMEICYRRTPIMLAKAGMTSKEGRYRILRTIGTMSKRSGLAWAKLSP